MICDGCWCNVLRVVRSTPQCAPLRCSCCSLPNEVCKLIRCDSFSASRAAYPPNIRFNGGLRDAGRVFHAARGFNPPRLHSAERQVPAKTASESRHKERGKSFARFHEQTRPERCCARIGNPLAAIATFRKRRSRNVDSSSLPGG